MAKSSLKISNIINSDYRTYVIHSIHYRGIPSWYDSLTIVQRYILNSVTNVYQPTLSVIGKSRAAGYHHGDAALDSAIEKMARKYETGMNLLDGYGFFGNHVTPEASSARYTQVKINPEIKTILTKYECLNYFNEEGYNDLFHVDVPLGLLCGINGIGTAYSSKILPRKLEDIQAYLSGKRKNIAPHFIGYEGNISKLSDKQWQFEPTVTIDKNSLILKDIPPTISYDKVNNKLQKYLEEKDYDLINNSQEFIEFQIQFKGRPNMDIACLEVKSLFTTTFTEVIVLIKDNSVIEYNKVEDYLEDYKIHIDDCLHKKYQYEINFHEKEKSFNEAKLEYLRFMVKQQRSSVEIEAFIGKYPDYISHRLDTIKVRHLHTEEIQSTIDAIESEKKIIAEFVKLEKDQKAIVEGNKSKESKFIKHFNKV